MAEMAQHPYSEYKLYVVLHKKENRRMANLVNSGSKKRTTVSYARYLFSVSLGRLLLKDEHVDHINDDKLDDRIENFQILTQEQNRRKQALLKPAVTVKFVCHGCGEAFERAKNRAYKAIHLGKPVACSRKCGRKKQ